MWTGQLDLNTDTCRRGNLESGRKIVDSKISGHVWTRPKRVGGGGGGGHLFQLASFMVVNLEYLIVA